VFALNIGFGSMDIFAMLIVPIHELGRSSIFWCFLWFLSSVFCSFHYKDLWLLSLNLFWGTLLFLRLLKMRLFPRFLPQSFHFWYIEKLLISLH
jgi:hypothetical protein